MQKLFKVKYSAYVSLTYKAIKLDYESPDGYGTRSGDYHQPYLSHSLQIELIECEVEKEKRFDKLKNFYEAQQELNPILTNPIDYIPDMVKTNLVSEKVIYSGRIKISLEDLLRYFPEEDEEKMNQIIKDGYAGSNDLILNQKDEYTFLLAHGIKGIYPEQLITGDVQIYLHLHDKFPKYSFNKMSIEGDVLDWGDNIDIWDDIEPYIKKYGNLDARYIP